MLFPKLEQSFCSVTTEIPRN